MAHYYRAETFYRLGDRERAVQCFEHLIKQADKIKWQRAAIYAQNWLADLLIEQEDYDRARILIVSGMAVADRNKDRRRAALFRRSMARLLDKQKDSVEAIRFAEEAHEAFDRLGMQQESEEMRRMLAKLRSNMVSI